MPWYNENARSTSGTSLRVRDPSPISGMCPICIRECPVLCEISKSAFRGREVLYPSPEHFGLSTAASNKDYLLNWSDLQIQVDALGAHGVSADPDSAIFPNVDVGSRAGGIPIKLPLVIPGLGSTDVARDFWEALAVGAALSGVILTVGENVCGMDARSKYNGSGNIAASPDLEHRVNLYRKYWDGRHGDIVVQTNVEDTRTGVDVYAIKALGVKTIERKWGQGAKAIGGEVRVADLEKAISLKRRGYIVIPDPEEAAVQDAFKRGVFRTFERHSRVGMPEERSFVEDVEWLREQGAERVFLKTGAYNRSVVAFTLRCASQAKIDMVTFDGAGGGTGMSPVPMMNECSTPTVYLLAQVLEGVRILRSRGKYVPDIAVAGGFVNETQMFKAIALSNFGDGAGPAVKAIGMARAPLTAAMKSSYFVDLSANGGLPKSFADLYGSQPDQFFITSADLRRAYGDAVGGEIPWSAVGVHTFLSDRLAVGLQQLLAGTRKWRLDLMSRGDLVSLTERCAKVTGIPLVEEAQREAFQNILDF